MRILLVTDSYPPEIRSASHLMEELAAGLSQRGFNVFVLTTYPQYNLTQEYEKQQFSELEVENNIKVLRVKTLPHHKVHFILRGIAQLTMPLLLQRKLKKYTKELDIVLVYSPPLPLALLGRALKKKYRAKFLLNVQDIFPQNAIDLGILKNVLMIKFFQYLERVVYRSADRIIVHSEGNLSFLQLHHKNMKDKFLVLHNWIDTKQFHSINRTNRYRGIYELQGKFIVLFAGVMGPSQGLDFVLQVAQAIQDLPEVVFLFVGDGMQRLNLEHQAKEMNLRNVVFKPFVSKKEYVFLVKDCDIGLVSLSAKNKTPVVPGKILGYMAAALPVVAFLNEQSDGHAIIQQAKAGKSCVHGDLRGASNLLRSLYNDRDLLQKMGQLGYEYVCRNFDRDVCLNKLIQIIEE